MGSHPTHTYCDEVLVMPSLRAVYVANQKAASRTIRTMFKELDPRSINILLPYAGYQKRCGARAASGLPPAFSNFTVFTFVRRPLDVTRRGPTQMPRTSFRASPMVSARNESWSK